MRDRRLRPGPGYPRHEVERNQRERMYGAVVASVDEVGYEGTNVAEIAQRAGVSRSVIYEIFGGRRECFLAAFETLAEGGVESVARAYAEGGPGWQDRLAQSLDAMFAVLVAQPAAARLCFLDAYAAGPPAAEIRDRVAAAFETLVRDAFEQSPERAGMPDDVIAAITGGIRTVTQTRLRRRKESELPALTAPAMRWLLTYELPDPPLRKLRTRPRTTPRFVATAHRERLFVALAKTVDLKGYANTSVADIVTTASVSLSTFYELFEGKEEAFLETCDFGIDQAFAAVRHAWERAERKGWPLQVLAGMRELLTFMASEPEWSTAAMVEIFAAGPRARARRDRTIELFTGLVEPGRELAPEVDELTVELLGGAVYALMYRQIRARGADRLGDILPATVFTVLAPFVGNAEATRIANRRN